jgi:hypothetical protein
MACLHLFSTCVSPSGRFMLATLQCQFVLEKITIGDRRKALNNLPIHLSEIYGFTIERIRRQSESKLQLALMVLTWVNFAQEPLKVDALLLALAVRSDGPTVDMDYSPSMETLLDCCHGLVVVEGETRTIRLAHFTVHQYLEKHWKGLFPDGHSIIANVGLTYLTCLTPHNHYDFFGGFTQETVTLGPRWRV